MQLFQLPTLENLATVRLDQFLNTAALIIGKHRIECETLSKARFLELCFKQSVPPFDVPLSDEHCREACAEYDRYQKELQYQVDKLLESENLNRKQVEQVKKAIVNKL